MGPLETVADYQLIESIRDVLTDIQNHGHSSNTGSSKIKSIDPQSKEVKDYIYYKLDAHGQEHREIQERINNLITEIQKIDAVYNSLSPKGHYLSFPKVDELTPQKYVANQNELVQ